MKNINDVLDFIYSQQRIDLGLERITEALERVGNPHLKYKTIHLAGTNGKGSTTNYIYTILREQGYKVGSFTSPFLETYNDRVRVNEKLITDEFVVNTINEHIEMIKELNLSFFEIFTFLAALYFDNQKVEFAIFEVGMGGRYDASNVVKPIVCAITNIGLDHMSSLGNTISEIAFQKAGIIKDNTPVFTTCQKEDAINTIKEVAKEKNSSFTLINNFDDFNYQLKMKGTYQKKNAMLALKVIEFLQKDFKIDEISITNGFKKAVWLGRFEEIRPNVFVDGAHNIEGVKGLVNTLKEDYKDKEIHILFSALKDKEVDEMLNLLKQFPLSITTFDFYRAMSHEQVKSFNLPYFINFKDAIDNLLPSDDSILVITGSLYFITEVRKYIINEK